MNGEDAGLAVSAAGDDAALATLARPVESALRTEGSDGERLRVSEGLRPVAMLAWVYDVPPRREAWIAFLSGLAGALPSKGVAASARILFRYREYERELARLATGRYCELRSRHLLLQIPLERLLPEDAKELPGLFRNCEDAGMHRVLAALEGRLPQWMAEAHALHRSQRLRRAVVETLHVIPLLLGVCLALFIAYKVLFPS